MNASLMTCAWRRSDNGAGERNDPIDGAIEAAGGAKFDLEFKFEASLRSDLSPY
jgi:hypothetical protein